MWHIHISVSISMWCLFLIHNFWSKFKRKFNVELESLGTRMEIVMSWGTEVFPNRDFNVQGWNNIIFGVWYYSLGYCLRRCWNSPERSPSPCKSPEQPVEAFRVERCQTCEAVTIISVEHSVLCFRLSSIISISWTRASMDLVLLGQIKETPTLSCPW